MPSPRASQALSRLTVLDLTRVRSGPTCVAIGRPGKIDALLEDDNVLRQIRQTGNWRDAPRRRWHALPRLRRDTPKQLPSAALIPSCFQEIRRAATRSTRCMNFCK